MTAAFSADLPTNTCPVTTTAALKEFRGICRPEQRPLDMVAMVTSVGKMNNAGYRPIVIEDRTGRAELIYRGDDIAIGDVMHFQGVSRVNRRLMPWDEPVTAKLVEKREPPAALVIPIDRIDARWDDLRTMTVEGTILASLADELDPRFWILILKDGRATLPVYMTRDSLPANAVGTGARIRVTGMFHRIINSWRQFQHPTVIGERIEILAPPPADPFDVPDLENVTSLTVDDITALGRRKVTGRVLAAWDGDRLMLKLGNGICFGRLQRNQELPPTETSVTVVGDVDANVFNLTLENAIWKPASSAVSSETEAAINLDTDEYFSSASSWKNSSVLFQGALVTLSGTVLPFPGSGSDSRRIALSCGQRTVFIGLGAMPESAGDLSVGTRLRVTGRSLLATAKTTSYDIFPTITGLTVITRTPADVEVLSRPPWWTPTRLLGVIAALFALLLGVIVWNRLLNRLVQRRSAELSRAEVERASSELRVAERTRLAVELHDSLSQNLTGIALAINAGEYSIAAKSLKSCRRELKNCLWDLRSDALEMSDMNEAIRRTLAPNISSAKLSVRFSLARNTLSDSTAYTILRIVRELAVNGIRHGGATEVRIAGSVEEQRILFSVRDNGCGFEPAKAPGTGEGHFGLEGIRDRIRNLNGEMKIESSPDKGTKVTICLKRKC